MLRFDKLTDTSAELYASVTLSFDQRVKSRQKVELDNGEAAGLFLTRGAVLQHGDKLQAETGEVIEVHAADESVSTLYLDDPLMLARTCYHLGNRHVPLQIGIGFIRYQHDHVLDEMIRGFKLDVVIEQARFEPEAGAYGATSHSHEHSHSDGGDHAHDH